MSAVSSLSSKNPCFGNVWPKQTFVFVYGTSMRGGLRARFGGFPDVSRASQRRGSSSLGGSRGRRALVRGSSDFEISPFPGPSRAEARNRPSDARGFALLPFLTLG